MEIRKALSEVEHKAGGVYDAAFVANESAGFELAKAARAATSIQRIGLKWIIDSWDSLDSAERFKALAASRDLINTLSSFVKREAEERRESTRDALIQRFSAVAAIQYPDPPQDDRKAELEEREN